MKIPSTLLHLLKENTIDYEVLPHVKTFSARTAAIAEHIPPNHQAKVVMVKCGEQPLMVVLPASRRLDLNRLQSVTGQPAALENEREFESLFPDCAVGAMPPFGRLYGVPTYVDKHLAEQDYIVFEAGTHTDAIKLRYRDYERVANPQVADLTIG